MNCHALARALDLVDLDARFDCAAASRHLAHCATCAARYPEVVALVGTPRPVPRAARAAYASSCAAALLLGATFLLDRAPRAVAPPRESTVASAASRAPEPPTRRPTAATGVRYLPSSASTVIYTSRRPVGDRDSREIESTVIRGGDRAAGTIELLR